MSRTRFTSGRPRRGGTYRPQLEALEGRLAPGALSTTLQPPGIDPGNAVAQRERESDQLVFLAGLQAGPGVGLLPTPAPDLPGPGPGAGGTGGIARGAPNGPVITTSPVVDFATRTIVYGESTVLRTADGITAQLTATGLEPGAYTFWMRVDAPGVAPAAGRLDGQVVGPSGMVTFSGHVNVGDIVGDPSIPGLEGTLQDPLHAQITLVVRNHGPVDPRRFTKQTHSFEPDLAFNFLISIHAPPP